MRFFENIKKVLVEEIPNEKEEARNDLDLAPENWVNQQEDFRKGTIRDNEIRALHGQISNADTYPYHLGGEYRARIGEMRERLNALMNSGHQEALALNNSLNKLTDAWIEASSKYMALATVSPEKKEEKEVLFKKLTETRNALEQFEKYLTGKYIDMK